ncbi:bifunctional RNase H/acid phosphatase [Streptomyces yaanensis]|uniref:Bifunctional RNase H/acid phosphatase n=1 Tax=Streptomyces yaanensis TaxID=1142239 RepID=A0ABV7SIS9_9ACTN|nr:bifunctional RNase H/acid phosphatase [Streptomyces sp. CGMCC 4.7035]WNC01539.1 bifunctional RNase H/acid phosphatase [Streptomyces sp. CGMCC 4.7035]
MREFIVEADGGSRGNPGPAGYGSVVCDAATGRTLAERAEFIGTATNNVAEYRGLLAGLRAAHNLDPTARVHVRMDSKLVVEQMSGRWKIKHPAMKPLAMQAAAVFPAEQVTYEWIPREQNKHADRLANEAMDAGSRGERWEPATSKAEPDAGLGTPKRYEPAGPPEPYGPAGAPEPPRPPGDAAAGAARARAALAGARGRDTATPAPAPVSSGAASSTTAPSSARRGVAERGEFGAGGASGVAGSYAEASSGDRGAADADVRAARNVASAPPDLGTPTTFVLLRHGETPLTPLKRFSGSGGSDPALSGVGRRQAELVAAALAARGTIQAVVSSPLARCRETAGVVAARLGLDVSVEDGLRETDFGAWEGLTFGEVRERHPDDMNAWLSDPEAEPTGGGESFAAVAHRVAATRDKLLASYAGRTVLLVSHVTPIKTLVRLALGAPPEALFRMELSAASLSAVAYYADGNAGLRLLNDTSHLR